MSTTPINILIEQLGNNDKSKERVASRKLVQRGEEAIPALVSALRDTFNDDYLTEPQKMILDVLAAIGEQAIKPLLKLLNLNVPALADGVCYALAKIGTSCDKAIDSLSAVLRDNDPSAYVRVAAAKALASMNNRKALQEIVFHVDDIPAVQKHVAIAMGKLGDNSAIGQLAAMLLDRDNRTGHMSDVRKHAAWALGEIGDKVAVQSLLEFVNDRKFYLYADALVHVIDALGRLHDRCAMKPLLEVIRDRGLTPEQHAAACKALSSLKDQRALPTLIRLAEKGDELERAAAIAAIGEIGAPWNLDTINEALHDDSAAVRKEAVIALGKLGTGDVVTKLVIIVNDYNEEKGIKKAACAAVERLGNSALKLFIQKLDHEDQEWQEAIRAMEQIGLPGSVGSLREVYFNEEDTDKAKEIKLAITGIVKRTLAELYEIKESSHSLIWNDGPVDLIVDDLLKPL